MQSKRPRFNPLILALALAAVLMVWSVLSSPDTSSGSLVSYSTVVHYFEKLQVTSFKLDLNTGMITLKLKEGELPLPETSPESVTQSSGGMLSGLLSPSSGTTGCGAQ